VRDSGKRPERRASRIQLSEQGGDDGSEGPLHPYGGGEEHGLSVFFRIEDDVFHTYSAYARGTESLTDAYRLLDMTPYGRQQDFEDSPPGWPQKPTYGKPDNLRTIVRRADTKQSMIGPLVISSQALRAAGIIPGREIRFV
jgi:hypothetical protein